MPEPFVKYAFLPFDVFYFVVKNKVFKVVWINIQVFDSVPFVLLSVFMLIPEYFQYWSSVVEFEFRNCDACRISFIVHDCFGNLRFFAFLYKVEYYSFDVCEEFWCDFDGHCIESVSCFW